VTVSTHQHLDDTIIYLKRCAGEEQAELRREDTQYLRQQRLFVLQAMRLINHSAGITPTAGTHTWKDIESDGAQLMVVRLGMP